MTLDMRDFYASYILTDVMRTLMGELHVMLCNVCLFFMTCDLMLHC